ncbi:adenosine deaminase [Nakamurella flavida]|uniref:adenosine deaminase n=1 Tax=Nakamurella flavida TaxID=363630 RepID=UPI00277EF432|nr:adenosine deaminase [Nakamurella flavida]MDP9778596.1 adenosine deaminase [Nakamurella flavida]
MFPLTSPPTAELHIHLEGTIEPAAVIEMARRNGVPAPAADLDELLSRYSFADLQSFLDLHYANLTVLRTEQDFFELATGYLDRARAANIRRAEIFFDPQTHLGNGVPVGAVMAGITGALADSERTHGISTDLIMCFLRDRGAAAADEMLTAILPFRDAIIGVGLDSTEIGFPPELFVDVYARAAAEGLHLVAHAGEEGGPETVTAALDLLHVERVDHGIRSVEDPDLVRRLRDEQVPLTVCPLSNVALRTVDTLADHPLPGMLADGLLVGVNSDDPPYFGGYVDRNYAALRTELGMTAAQLEQLALNSFESCFLDRAVKDAYQDEVRAHFAGHAAESPGDGGTPG